MNPKAGYYLFVIKEINNFNLFFCCAHLGVIIKCSKFNWRLTDTCSNSKNMNILFKDDFVCCDGWRIKSDNVYRWKQRIKNKQDNNWYEVCITLSYWTHIHPSFNCYLFLIRHSTHNNDFVLFKRAGQNLVMSWTSHWKSIFLVNQKHGTGRI